MICPLGTLGAAATLGQQCPKDAVIASTNTFLSLLLPPSSQISLHSYSRLASALPVKRTGALFSAIMSTGRICPCLTEAAPEAAAPASPSSGGTVMDDGVGSDAAGDWGPNIDGGQGEKAGKIRAFSSSKRSPWTWAES